MAMAVEILFSPLTIILSIWLVFELIEFFRLGEAGQPLAWCIVKISVFSSTIIGLTSDKDYQNMVKIDILLEKFKSLCIDEDKTGLALNK